MNKLKGWIRPSAIALIIVASLFIQACGFNLDLRSIFAASPAFIDSLNLGSGRAAVASDFVKLGSEAVTLNDNLKACSDNPCKATAVNTFQGGFQATTNEDQLWQTNSKLARIKKITNGLLLAAQIYYGGSNGADARSAQRVVTDDEMKARIKELREAMK